MSILRLSGYDATNQFRQISSGDNSITGDIVPTAITAGTVSGVQATSPIISLNSSGNITLPSAADIISALIGNIFTGQNNRTGLSAGNGVNPSTSWRVQYINVSAGVASLVGSTDGTTAVITTNSLAANIAASSAAVLLFTVLNGTPGQVISASTTNGSAVVTGLSDFQTSQITPGMAVSGTGIPAGATIATVQPGIGFTLSATATATNPVVGLTCLPRVRVERIG